MASDNEIPLELDCTRDNENRPSCSYQYREQTRVNTPVRMEPDGDSECQKQSDDGSSINSEESYVESDPLYIGIKSKDLETLESLLADNPDDVNKVHPRDGWSPLHTAVLANGIESCRLLLRRGADIEYTIDPDDFNWTVLHVAMREEVDVNVLKFLLEHGAGTLVNTQTTGGDCPLHMAVNTLEEEKKGIYPFSFILTHAEPITVKQLEKALVLIGAGADVSVAGYSEYVPLHYAVCLKEVVGLRHEESISKIMEMVQLLLDKGSDIGATTEFGNTVLHLAAEFAHLEVFQMIFSNASKHSFDICRKGMVQFETPLELAVARYNRRNSSDNQESVIAMIEAFLKHGASLETWSVEYGEPVFVHLLTYYSFQYIKQIFEKRATFTYPLNFDASSYSKQSLLHICSIYCDDGKTEGGWLEKARLLIDLGAKVDSRDINGTTPLQLCCKTLRSPQLLELLLLSGADVAAVDRFGRTVLHYPSMPQSQLFKDKKEMYANARDMIKSLMRHKASFEAKDANGLNALQFAGVHGMEETESVLMEYGSGYHVCMDLTDGETSQKRQKLDVPGGDECSSDKVWNKFWEKFPRESLISGKTLAIDELDDEIERVKAFRGDVNNFVHCLLNTRGIGPVVHMNEQVITAQVTKLVTRISEAMTNLDNRFHASVELAGSNREGTKVNKPDEFDFLFKLSRFSGSYTLDELSTERPDHVYLTAREDVIDDCMLDYQDRHGDLHYVKVANTFRYLMKQTLSDLSLWENLDLYLVSEQCGRCIPSLNVVWVGGNCVDGSDMEINIDFVPCFEADITPDFSAKTIGMQSAARLRNEINQHGCLVLFKSKFDENSLQISMQPAELRLIQSMPEDVKDALILCKTLLDEKLCPNFKKKRGPGLGLDSHLLLTSYILKTAVFHISTSAATRREMDEHITPGHKEEAIRMWAIRAVTWIEKHVSEGPEIPGYFIPEQNLLADYGAHESVQVPIIMIICKYLRAILEK